MQEEKQTSNIQLSSTPQPTHYTSNGSLKKIQLSSCSRPGNGCIFHVCNFPAENFRPWRVPIPGIDDAAPSAQRSLLFHSRHENQTVRVPGKVGPCLKSPCRCNSRPQSFDHHFLITFTRPQLYGQNIEELDVLCDSFSKSFFWVGCLCS